MKNELVVCYKPKSNISEEIRTIRTNLQFTSVRNSKVLLVTSSVPGEGKSFISSNLACAFAQTGERTLIVDCDLRLGRDHKIFDVSNSTGFSNLLSSSDYEYDKYIKRTSVNGLYIIPRGPVPPNPSELLNSNNARRFVSYVRDRFDHVIFDGVPIKGLPDSLVMASIVDRVIIVSSLGYTNIDDLNETKKSLEKIDANIAGVIINKAKRSKMSKYSNYYE